MIKVAQYCRDGTGWNVAHGTRISLWYDRWIVNNLSLRHLIQGPIPRNELNKSIASIITNASRDISTLSFILPPQIHSLINNTVIDQSPYAQDTPYWHHTLDGNVLHLLCLHKHFEG